MPIPQNWVIYFLVFPKRLPNKKISRRFEGRGAGGGKVILVAEIWIIFFVEFSKRLFDSEAWR
jgi:hypothetical protein